jgi:hypothetical protein
MARKQTIDAILGLFKKLGGNTNDVLGTKTNVNFLGKGKSPELMLDMDINADALAVLPQSKAVEELTSSVGYAVSGKLNDIQANQLLRNMQTMDSVYFPPAAPANVTDLATGTRDLDKAGLMSLRQGGDPTKYKAGDPITSENFAATGFAPSDEVLENLKRARELDDIDPNSEIAASLRLEEKGKKLADSMSDAEIELRSNFPTASDDQIKQMLKTGFNFDDLPPSGSRGGPDDIAAPFSGAGLEAIKNVKGTNLIIDDIVNKIYLNAGVSANAQPVARANAREFLNRVKDLEDPSFPDGPTLSSIMEADDFRFMTEGGGGGMGDPLLLVQKYFGPKVASSVAQLDSADDIQKFAERLVAVKDAKGRNITDRNFDPDMVDPEDFEFAKGGLARPGFFRGKLVGKALGLYKRKQALEKGAGQGFAAVEQYGITGKDITRMFKELAVDPSLQGKEKTEYFKVLNQALKNPEEFPDTIKEIQMKLGIEIGTGFRNGGLAGILEV